MTQISREFPKAGDPLGAISNGVNKIAFLEHD